MTVLDFAPRFRKAADTSGGMTPFERDVTIAFETHRHNRTMTHLCVALQYDTNSPQSYVDPHSKIPLPATVDIFTLDREDSPEDTVHIMGVYKSPVVIMIDLRGPPLAEQIPGWKAGTIHFPAQFAENPAINMSKEEDLPAPQPPPARRPALRLIEGGLAR